MNFNLTKQAIFKETEADLEKYPSDRQYEEERAFVIKIHMSISETMTDTQLHLHSVTSKSICTR